MVSQADHRTGSRSMSIWWAALLTWIIGGPIWARYSKWKRPSKATRSSDRTKLILLLVFGGPFLWLYAATVVTMRRFKR